MSRIEKLQEFLQHNKEDNFLQHALALEYIKIGEDEKAKEIFETILNREPGYVGSYYHLGKLLERLNKTEDAMKVYETGMEECMKISDKHAYNELQMALEDLS